MVNINTGGPAFPIPLQSGQSWQGMAPCDGMTLRDYFAARAAEYINWNSSTTELCAKRCYEIADAMIKSREAA